MSQQLAIAAEHPIGFEALGLSRPTLDIVARTGFKTPTAIQALAIPPALLGKDVIGCAATGTGKTAAFVLPLIDRLAGKKGTHALVLAPTRELALQIATEIKRFGEGRGFQATVIIGGLSLSAQTQELRSQRSAIVATPGRLVDHLERGTAKLDQIDVVVLDEADRMLDMGFAPQLKRILAALPPRGKRARQTLLFSATMAGEVSQFARGHLIDPVRLEAHRSGAAAARVEQRAYFVPQDRKTPLLLELLGQSEESTLIFTRTKRRADKVVRSLQQAEFSAAVIHADRSQGQRRQAMEGFSRGRYRILVATDIAARGIDVADIGHVVNFDLPHVAEDYVHRIGRTGRAAKSGRASSLVAPDELALLRGIERLTRAAVTPAALPKDFAAASAGSPKPNKPTEGSRPQRDGWSPDQATSGRREGGRGRPASGHKPKRGAAPVRIGSWKPKRRGHR